MAIHITNPISKKRFSLRRRVHRRITKYTILLLRHTKTRKGLLGELREQYEHSRDQLETVSAADHGELDLLTISIADLIPVENLHEFHKGVKRFLQKYRTRTILAGNDIESIAETLTDTEGSLVPGRWSHLGVFEFNKGSSLSEFIWYGEVELTHFTSSLAVVYFHLTPSQEYTDALKALVRSEQYGELVFQPTIKSLFRFWKSTTYSPVITKQQMLIDALLELKWRFFKEVSQYLPLFLFNNESLGPSIEVYKLDEHACKLRSTKRPFDDFWPSIGMSRQSSFYFDMSLDGAYGIFSEQFSQKTESAEKVVKIAGNSKQALRNGMQDINHQIRYKTKEFRRYLLSPMVVHAFCDLTSRKLARHRGLLYRTVAKRRIRYKTVVKLRLDLEKEFQILGRMAREIRSDTFNVHRMAVSNIDSDLEPVGRTDSETWPLKIVNFAPRLVADLVKNFELVTKMVDDRLGLLTIKSSYRIQFWTLILAFFTLVLTGITVYVSFLSK